MSNHPYGVRETMAPNTSMAKIVPKTFPAGTRVYSPKGSHDKIEKEGSEMLKESEDKDTLQWAESRLKKAIRNTVESGQVSRSQFTTDLDFAKQIVADYSEDLRIWVTLSHVSFSRFVLQEVPRYHNSVNRSSHK